MDHSCNCHSEISRDGSGQLDRYLKALDPSYTLIDDRSIADLLVFAKRYAGQIRFYDIPGSNIGGEEDSTKISWREFFRRDIAVITASIATFDLEQTKKDYDELRARVEAKPGHSTFDDLFEPIIGMAGKIDGWYALALPEYPLYADLQLAINSNLKAQLQKVKAYEEGFKYVDSKNQLHLDYSSIHNEKLWGINDTIDADITIYGGAETDEKILNAALYVDDIFSSFYRFMAQLISKSDSYMQFALEHYPAHQPHMALFIAFLKLFRLAQDQLNGLTGRMLDFYYKDILHLTAKPSIPDKVHIVFELAKDVAQYDVALGTALKAGRDADGKEQIYKTENDLVVNGAKVKELKTIFIDKTENIDTTAQAAATTINSIYARPVAKSKDGFGEPFDTADNKWATFGKGNTTINTSKNLCSEVAALTEGNRKDAAQVGFAIASPQLVLQGGNRIIALNVTVEQAKGIQGTENVFDNSEIILSAGEGWLKIDSQALAFNKSQGDFEGFIKKALDEGRFPVEDAGSAEFIACYLVTKELLSNAVRYGVVIYLPVAEAAIAPFDAKLHKGYPYDTSFPVMQVMMNPNLSIAYNNFITVQNVSLAVRVGSINKYDDTEVDIDDVFLNGAPNMDGLKSLTIVNDDGAVTLNKPFDPFTAYPKTGSSLYIGSNEVFNKTIDELSVNIMFQSEMTNDVSQRIFNLIDRKNIEGDHAYLKTNVLEKRQWTLLSRKDGNDFNFNTLTQNILFKSIPAEEGTNTVPVILSRKPISYNPELSSDTYKGFIRIDNDLVLQRNTDRSFFELMQELAQLIKIKEVSLSYHSNLSSLETGIDQLFHVYPFGVVETYLKPAGDSIIDFTALDKAKDWLLVNANNALLPQFNFANPYADFYKTEKSVVQVAATALNKTIRNKAANELLIGRLNSSKSLRAVQLKISERLLNNPLQDEVANQYTKKGKVQEGMLLIGLEKLKPLQTISMLFQFAEGSAGNEDEDPPSINWSYLSYNEWKPLKGENIISDGTYGFQTTGIIMISIPEDASTHNTIVTDGLLWLCASVDEHSDYIPQLIDIITQAVEAKFEDNGNAPSHFDTALSVGSISKLVTPVAQVSKVAQPFASFDGKHSEIGGEFYTRVSERLRHKGRAITAWDYEHLVLDRFPSIYKVKCITHTDPNCLCRNPKEDTCCGPQITPGHVLLIPIANLKNRNAANPLQPKTSRRTLLAIQEYVKTRTSPFVHVHAKNPVYEEIIVSFKVQFYTGTDKGYYMKQLNEEIVHFLTPWAFDENAAVTFNQAIYASSIINFIEERPYVDFITDFVMGVCCNECCLPAATVAGTPVTGNVKDSSGKPLENVGIRAVKEDGSFKDLPNTDAQGTFSFNEAGIVLLILSLNNYQSKSITIGKQTELIITLYKWAEVLQHADSCTDIEWLLQSNPDLEGDIVARPCTSRSILVSVPQHIIVPYKAPERLSPCEQRKQDNSIRLTKSKSPNGIEIEKFGAVAPKAVARPKKELVPKRTAPEKTATTPKVTQPKKGTAKKAIPKVVTKIVATKKAATATGENQAPAEPNQPE